MSKLLVVIGATGQQGGSVVDQVLADPVLSAEYRVRGTTRDPSNAKSQALKARGVDVVRGELSDPTSLVAAFAGAHVVYANSVTVYDGHAYEHEVEHGKALADAAVKAKVPYYIYSTLPNGGKISGGKYKHLGHFDGKEVAEQYVRTLPIKSAFFSPGTFMSNFHESMAPRPSRNNDGTFAWAGPMSPETQLPLIDTAGDTGKWVAAILADFDKYEGKVLTCATRLYTVQEVTDIISKASGKTIRYHQVPAEVFKGFLLPPMADHVTEMLLYFQDYGYFGENTEEKVKWSAEQARGKLTTFEEFLEKNPLKL